jgi:tRNA1(Val) A37 N6-methylase TrmN6
MLSENYSGGEKRDIASQIKDISLSTIEKEFQALMAVTANHTIATISPRCRTGNNIVDFFTFLARLEVKGKYNVTFFEFLANVETFQKKKFISNMFDYYARVKNKQNKKPFFKVCKEVYNICVSSINIIRPLVYMEIYAKYRPTRILDFCAGWGGAAVAAATFFQLSASVSLEPTESLESYTGIEINHALQEPYQQLISFLERQNPACAAKIRMCFVDALTVDYASLNYDFVFTSPPYYFIQKYENNVDYKDKEEMNERFYRPLFAKTFSALQPNGVYAINVCQEVFTNVLQKMFGDPDETFPYKKSKRQNDYQEMVYVWRKGKVQNVLSEKS